MRIVHAVRSDAFAGVERHVAVLAAGQAESGDEVHVLGGDPRLMSDALRRAGVITHPSSSTAEVVRRLVALRNADVIHAHMTAAEAAATLVRPVVQAPLVVTRHFGGRRGGSAAGRVVAPMVRRAVRAQLAISHYVAERVDGPSTVVYPGISRPLGLTAASGRSKTVLVAQRLEREKRTGDALRAFAAGAPQDWRLLVAGDGSERAMLEALAIRLGVEDRATFLGHSPKVRQLMTEASILVAPCDVEGLGLSVLEGMAAGIPIVASGAGGHLETVGRATPDLLYKPQDWAAAAERLRALIDSPRQREAAALALREVQHEWFSIPTQVASTRAAYEEVLT